MNLYQKYVFDLKKRKFIGNFENMYKMESIENYDSWFQDDLRHLHRKIILTILSFYNFDIIFDIGCGKGTFTHLLKKKNNEVIGIDASSTACNQAIIKYPDIKWICEDISKKGVLDEIFIKIKDSLNENTNTLTLLIDVLSYLKNWREVIKISSKFSKYLLISLYIPKNPIGFVKNFKELEKVVNKYFYLEEVFILKKLETYILFGKKF